MQSKTDIVEKYKKQLGQLTRATERKMLKKDMEIYFLEQMIEDFKALCDEEQIEMVKNLDTQRRKKYEKHKH